MSQFAHSPARILLGHLRLRPLAGVRGASPLSCALAPVARVGARNELVHDRNGHVSATNQAEIHVQMLVDMLDVTEDDI